MTMENLIIDSKKGNYITPGVNFSSKSGECVLAGESYLEDAWKFYQNLINWLDDYCVDLSRPLEFKFKLSYFNTSSSRCLLALLKKLGEFDERGGDIAVMWYCSEEDLDLRDEIEELAEDAKIDILILPMA